MYEEGPDLDADEAAESAAFRPVALAALPGGGIKNGAIVAVSDQAQAFEAQLVVSHRVGRGGFLQCRMCFVCQIPYDLRTPQALLSCQVAAFRLARC